ncbi:hypothetical protein [Tepidibacillus marianensis]|uniref:hypothetical protein n=1 Tax=Tepidibacillus marianensis TaxID=3131995 RepID=UPI0030CE9F4F
MRQEEKECPKCGHRSFGEGVFKGYAVLRPTDKILSMGSEVIATVCLRCGRSFQKNPDKFKQ